MKTLEVQKTPKTPYVILTDCSLTVSGRSYPENAVGFYKPFMDFLNEFDSFEDFSVDFVMEYINTSSSKSLLYILKNIADKTRNEVILNWYIDKDDDGMDDLAEHFTLFLNNTKVVKINK